MSHCTVIPGITSGLREIQEISMSSTLVQVCMMNELFEKEYQTISAP
jgi:hypothetical protein